MRPRPGSQWDRRIERASELAKIRPYAAEILGFYARLTSFQQDSYFQIQSALAPRREPGASLPATLDRVDLALMMRQWSPFLGMIGHEGPAALATFVHELSVRGPVAGAAVLESFWRNHVTETQPNVDVGPPLVAAEITEKQGWPTTLTSGSEPPLQGTVGSRENAFEEFCARIFLQPYAEFLSERVDLPQAASRPRVCHYCASPPLAGVLRQEGEGAARSLICSFCRTEWPYLRIGCPTCDERDERKMCVYASAEFECVRIEACDTCRSYIKTVDLTKDGRAVPEVDELAAIPLTLWAEEHGYSKPAQNVFGV